MALKLSPEMQRLREIRDRLKSRNLLRGDENLQTLRATSRTLDLAEGDIFDPNTRIAARSIGLAKDARAQERLGGPGSPQRVALAEDRKGGPAPAQPGNQQRLANRDEAASEFNRQAGAARRLGRPLQPGDPGFRPSLAQRSARAAALKQEFARRRGGDRRRLGPLGLPVDRATEGPVDIAVNLDSIPTSAISDRQIVRTPDRRLYRFSARTGDFLPMRQEPLTGRIVIDTGAIQRDQFVSGLTGPDSEFYIGLLNETDAGAPYIRALQPIQRRRAAALASLASGSQTAPERDHLQSIADQATDQIGSIIYDSVQTGAAGEEATRKFASRLKMGKPQVDPDTGLVTVEMPNGSIRIIKPSDQTVSLVHEARKRIKAVRKSQAETFQGPGVDAPITDDELRQEMKRIREEEDQNRRVSDKFASQGEVQDIPAGQVAVSQGATGQTQVAGPGFGKNPDGTRFYATSDGTEIPAQRIDGQNYASPRTLEEAALIPVSTLFITPSGEPKVMTREFLEKLARANEPTGNQTAERTVVSGSGR